MNKSLRAAIVVILVVWFVLVSMRATAALNSTLPQRHRHTDDVLAGRRTVTARPRATPPPVLPPATTAIGFQTAPHISAGTAPSTGLAVSPYLSAGGDFNHDGRQDVASIGQDADGVFWLSILLSNGDGTFQQPVLTAILFTTSDLLAVGDLNGDGNADVVVVHNSSLDVFLGDGTGKFSTAANYATSISNPVAVALLDTNGDSFVDVIIASGTTDGTGQSPVNTLLGNGSGTLAPAITAHYNGTMGYGVFADLNSDGHLDLVSATQVFFGTAGDYQPPLTLTSRLDVCQFPYGTANGSVTVADVNGDGRPDVVTADCANGTITVFLNEGTGSFAAGISTWVSYLPSNVTIADVNGDGKPDAIVSDFYSMDIYILLGNKDGTFTPATMGYPAGGDLWTAPVVADFNSDGRPDLLIPSGIGGQWESLVLLAGLGDGGLVAPHDYFYAGGAPGSTAYAWGIASADLNGDGLPDFVVGNQAGDTSVGVTVFLSNAASPDTSLHVGVNYGSGGNLQFVSLADIDGDGNPDIIASNTVPGASGEIQVFLGHGDGTFASAPTKIPVVSGSGLGRLVVGDFDGDGKPDIAVLDTGTVSSNQTFLSNVWVLVNRSTPGTPAFTTPVNYALTTLGGEIAAADLGNHHLDLLITQTQSTAVSIFLGDGTGSFAPQPDFDLGMFYPSGLAVAQLNPAGHPDLVVSVDDSNAGMGIAVASGNGDGTFAPPVLYPATSNTVGTITPFPQDVRVADLNGDGFLDIVYANAGDGTVGVLYGTGQWGSGQSPFYEPIEFAANGAPLTLLLADVNGDGALDAVIEGSGYSGVTTLLNTGANQLTLFPGSIALGNHLKSLRSVIPHAAPGQFTFSATVGPLPLPGAPPSATPSGTVTFRDANTVLGVVATSAGSATVTPTLSTPGTHIITATYSGDDHYVGQTQATLIQTIDAPGSAYILSANRTNATLTPGQSAQFVITATPNPTSTDTVTFSCGSLPAGISCSFNPSSLVLNGTNPQSTTLTVTVAPTFVAGAASPRAPWSGVPAAGLSLAIGCAVMVRRRQRISGRLAPVLAVIALAVLLVATGCSNNPGNGFSAPTPMTVRVLASGLGKGGAQQLNLTVNIHP